MKKKVIFFLLVLFCCFQLVGQKFETNFCTSIAQPLQKLDDRNEVETNELLNVFITKQIYKIMTQLGLKMNFIVRINNDVRIAKAKYNIATRTKYIDFNKSFFMNFDKPDYEINMILAHEIGHHLNFDLDHYDIFLQCDRKNDINKYKDWQEKELAADFFSGSMLFKLGADRTLSEKLINKLLQDLDKVSIDSRTHPKADMRVKEFWIGYNEAEKSFKRIYDNQVVSAEHLRNEGLMVAYSGNNQITSNQWEKALSLYDQAIEMNPNSPLLYAERGYLNNKNMDTEAAIKDYIKAIEIDAENPNYYLLAREVHTDSYFLESSANDLKNSSSSSIKELEQQVQLIKEN